MQAEVTELIQNGGRITGVHASTPEGELKVHADLTIGADGRNSTVRERAGLDFIELGAPMDALWLRLSRRPGDPEQTFGRFDAGRILVMIDRGDYWQCAYVIPKGDAEDIRRRGLPSLRDEIGRVLSSQRRASLPLLPRLMRRWPLLRRTPARVIGMGFLPEHVRHMRASRPG